tara:strand:- start:616 stop:729 length:114 start_codon:yes stop_codon:yes gene_type:complete
MVMTSKAAESELNQAFLVRGTASSIDSVAELSLIEKE